MEILALKNMRTKLRIQYMALRHTYTNKRGLLDHGENWQEIPRLEHREEKYRKQNKRSVGHSENISYMCIRSPRRRECDLQYLKKYWLRNF